MELAANPRAAGVGGALLRGQEAVDSPETAGRRGLAVVSGSCPKGEIGAGHGVAELFAGVAARVSGRVVAGKGIVRVRAGDEGGRVIIKGGLALFGRPAQVREFFNLAGQLVENGSFDKLAQKQPLLLAVVDAVFTAEGG